MTGPRDFHDLAAYRQWVHMRRLLRDHPIDDIRRAGLAHIDLVDANVHGDYFHRIVDDWRRALTDPDPTRLYEIAADTTGYGVDMRQNSPIIGLMDDDERWRMIQDSRREWEQVTGRDARRA